MDKQEIIDYLKGQNEWSGNHHYSLVNKSELISMIEDLDELEFKNYLRDIKSQIDYLRIQGPGKVKSLRMLENMVDNMLTGYWSSTSIRTQKVKVPEFVVEWFEENKHNLNFAIYELCEAGKVPVDLYEGLTDFERWFYLNHDIDTLIRMQDGYEVEEEPKYYLVIPYYYGYMTGNKDQPFVDRKEDASLSTEFEIKAVDERLWPFAVPVEKV